MIFTINPAPYLLEFKKDLSKVQKNSLFYRNLKKVNQKKEPENTIASSAILQSLIDIVKKIYEEKFSFYPKKDASIKKIVEVYKNYHYPTGELNEIASSRNYNEGYYFEIFTLIHRSIGMDTKFYFIYISKYASQKKTVDHIIDKGYLNKEAQNIVLTDKYNKSGGEINTDHIKSLFEQKGYFVKIYNIEDFMQNELYVDKFNTEIFHQGSFNINNFVDPYTESSDENTASFILSEWFKSSNQPILIMTGMGGIGKTTVVKHFLDNLYKKSESTNILFINSHELIDDVLKQSKKTETIFDFYTLMVDKAEKNEFKINNKFDEKLLELSIDSGNLIIAIDGIEEVIHRVGSKFNVNEFIGSIFGNYSENFENAKILITCRENSWEKTEYDNDIKEVLLEPFSKELAEKYFNMTLESKESKIEKSPGISW